MLNYIIRRLLLIIPTLLGIMIINFIVIQAAPGGPVDQLIAQLRGEGVAATERVGAGARSEMAGPAEPGLRGAGVKSSTRASRGIDPELIKKLEKQFGLDKPAPERFALMLKNYVTFDFGESFFKDRKVVDLVLEKMPVSISLGLWTTLLVYFISIPLGIAKAVRDGSKFDIWTSGAIITGNAIPGFLFAILLIILFAGGRYLDWFPLRGLLSDEFAGGGFLACVTTPACIADYFWHITLPIVAMVIGGFAGLTMLTKNSFLEEINKQYVITARAKGLTEWRVLYGHVFRNSMLIVIAGFPSAFIGILFTGSLLIEVIFSLDGLGLLGFEAALGRDYPVMFAALYFFSLLGLLMRLIGDFTYVLVDPRIDFESREV
ncbi:MAG: microcin C ABC transporter permease YejB [Proteobacteria bacterium]|nr:microcin C ABC transporter permease YejB [Pseudomonadota bacterium]